MKFGELFGKSWKEYKLNFSTLFTIMFLFYAIPQIIVAFSKIANPGNIVIEVLLGILFIFVSLYGTGMMTLVVLKKKKFSLSQAADLFKGRYWGYVGFSIVVGIFTVLLFMLLIIPGIIFAVFWAFSYYIFLDEEKGILESLKQSKKIVKGRWWKVFGYFLLLILIMVGIALVIALLALPLILSGASWAIQLVDVVASIIVTPFGIIFGKNFYMAMKGKKK